MSTPTKICYYNLRDEIAADRIPAIVGRRGDLDRLDRVVERRMRHHAFVVGESGIGKTAFIHGWVRRLANRRAFGDIALLQFSIESLHTLDASEERAAEALARLPACILLIDQFGSILYRNDESTARIARLLEPLIHRPDIHLVCTIEPHEYSWLGREHGSFARLFEPIVLKKQDMLAQRRILSNALPRLNAGRHVLITDDAIQTILKTAERYPALGELPLSAIALLDDSIALSVALREKVLSEQTIGDAVAAKIGMPQRDRTDSELTRLRSLEQELNKRIVGQPHALSKIATTLQRAKLGLRNPNRPLGSFLMLGPSGVGKTETAKCVAELIFGSPDTMIRFDMSEFQQEHTIGRLIGAPAGYVGYDEGGALTNALKREPHSLILLDEIEKAHPKVFDIFLQVLDDGRLTSGQNETIDARHAIIMATSNAAVQTILDHAASRSELNDGHFIRQTIIPHLTEHFRLEFINRFDNILVFQPLSEAGLLEVALLELKKMEARLSHHRVRFTIEPAVIADRIHRIADPRFGARPVKRFVEETCETLIAQTLLTA